ncbi:MAG: CHRD domain-containing protein [Candidatus Rokuibacteriota bacterium]
MKTEAHGTCVAGTELSFKLIVANIEDINQAHIHCGAAGVAGPVVAFLYGLNPVVSPDGILSEGTVTAASVIPRPDSVACPGGVANFAALLAKMQSGDAYVNVHTLANLAGEIRGQIHRGGPKS